MAKATNTKVRVANYHTGGITFPRRGPNKVHLAPLRLAPGTVTPVDKELWGKIKTLPQVKYYLDKKLLAEVPARVKEVPASIPDTVDLEVPEHLAEEEVQGKEEPAKATTRRRKKGTAKVK